MLRAVQFCVTLTHSTHPGGSGFAQGELVRRKKRAVTEKVTALS